MLCPASAAQQRLWFLYQLDSGDTSYNMPQVFRLRGRLNRDALCESLNRIVARHAALRTTFTIHDHLPTQRVHETLVIELPVIDVSASGVDSGGDAIEQLIDEDIRRPFNLEQGPLIRAVLFRLSPEDHVLLITEHHIVFDRTSEGLFFKELTALYEYYYCEDRRADLSLPDLPIQYSDYTKWRMEKSQDDSLARQLAYWRDRLTDIQPMELPTDRPASKFDSTSGERLYLALQTETVNGIETLARENGATMFIGLLAAFKVLLHQWTGSNDIIVGTPFADRRLNGTKDLLGFFVNNIVLRTDVSDEYDFLQLLTSVRKVCFGAYRHNSVPFEKLVEHLRPDRQENRNPLFDIQFAFQKLHPKPLILGDLSVSSLTPSKGTSQYYLTLTVREQPDGYDVRIEYRTDLFDTETINRLMHRFGDLLEIIVRNPERKLSEYPCLHEEEQNRITRDWNSTYVDYPRDKCIQQLLEDQARQTPDSVAVTCGEERISYQELDCRANRLANFLQSQGLGPEKIAAICVERSVDMVVGLLAILKAGGAYVPLDRSYPNNRLSHMLEDSGTAILLTQSWLLDQLPDTNAKIVLLDGDAHKIERESDKAPELAVVGENLAYVIYTSGSTGVPKGVQVEHRNVVNFLNSMRHEPGMNSDDVLLAVTTLSFDIAVLEIFLPLMVGARTVLASHDVAIDGERLLELLLRENVTMMQATPVTWQMLIEAGWQRDTSFRVLCGGEAMPRDLARALIQRSDNVWNMYGPTETTVWSTCYRIIDANAPLLIGRPIANTSTFVLDRQMRPVPVGRTGELYIGGDGVTRGYLNRPELTNERYVSRSFDDDPAVRLYATGDGVRYLSDGNIEYLNRLDNQVKVRGNRIELGEIQVAIVACSEIKQAVVIVREDDPGDPRIAAYYVLEPSRSIAGNEVRKQLRESLPAYMIPQYFIELGSLPLTPNGKIDRKALPAPDLDALTHTDSYHAPRTDSEIALASIWQDLLGLETVGIRDNFVEMGGHSLLALQAISRIRHEIGVDVPAISMIMDTLEQIAAQFDDEGPVSDDDDGRDTQVSNIAPFYFGHEGELFGLHHEPSGAATRDNSILLCGPVYMESIKAHWALKRLADQLAPLLFHVLRFHYLGSGDSLGESHQGNVSRWLRDIQSAADQLVAMSGIEHLSIVGLRLGATLAAMSEIDNVRDLVLWDPVTDGREYMEYLRDRHRSLIASCNAHRNKPVSQGKNELLGYTCSLDSQRMIEDIRIAKSFNQGSERVILVVPEHTQDHILVEQAIDATGKNVTRHIVEDARCEIDDYARLMAFLPGESLRVITSVFAEEVE
jgi:amino acid adenylation domain-containing protein